MAPKGNVTKKVPSKTTHTKGKASSDAKKEQAKAVIAATKKTKSKPIIADPSDESDEYEMRDASDSEDGSYDQPKTNKKTYVEAHTNPIGPARSQFSIPDRFSTINSYSATQ